MASYSIEKRPKANGDISHRAVVFVKNKGKIIHRESKTFSKKTYNNGALWALSATYEF
ncbi:hypothetical protein N481_05535 [Pseudoalteromonas luteoviolacea S4047-1]|uniref:Uncharacterized protein n=1 Tax=Pseudoalteromonas luteoviolacea S4054 TaxID=1129367 RepID=A0A0F6AE88_9GAMM|nr:hypothetical protein N479_11995 [Pseudoalteromonas luteoviolacea S4054]KZN77520.1 hypothetical protein N481_05535 [Pseudoalteromonas luteoviolacea S4047-1]